MTPQERFDNNLAFARDGLRKAADQLDKAVDELMLDERRRALIDHGGYVEPRALKSARSRVKSLLHELEGFSLAAPQAVIEWTDVEEVIGNGGKISVIHTCGTNEHAELLNDQDEVVAFLAGWRRSDGTAWYSVYPPEVA